MALAFFKFGLPVLLGYTLFVGISARWNPFKRPILQEERPSWLLGLWSGCAISLVLGLALQRAYRMPTDEVGSLLIPGLSILAVLILPALILFAYHRHQAGKAQWIEPESALDLTLSHEDPPQPPVLERSPVSALPLDEHSTNPQNSQTEISQIAPPQDTIQQTHAPDAELLEQLSAEIALREETEKHLRITRKALAQLEAETRHFSIDKADGIIALEEQLAQSIKAATVLESDALREKARRVEVEQNNSALKQKMVKAKQEIRRGAAARARALSTANKSIAFARQCVQIRGRLEASLEEAQATIENRQKTITGLQRALEKQKRKTQQEVSAMAKQMILHEKQLKARRSLEQVARSVENKLSTRLVKKVAKAKPLISDTNQGESS